MSPRPLEVSAIKLFKSLGEKRCLVAVSGGSDSMALLYLCANLKNKVKLKFIVGHVHHGNDTNKEFRDRAKSFVAKICKDLGLDFVSNDGGSSESQSESSLRNFRLAELKKLKDNAGCEYVLFGHHADDLLETRLIRLIRGTGPDGLRAMREVRGNVIRPLLSFSKSQVSAYLELIEGEHLEDPSNLSVGYLRNWIRRKWLPALEQRRPGASHRLASSLVSLVDVVESLDSSRELSECLQNNKINRANYIILSASDKRRVLGRYLQQRGFKDYGLSHINELIKRLDVEQNDLTFRLLKKIWLANAKHIWSE